MIDSGSKNVSICEPCCISQQRRLETLVADGSVWRLKDLARHGITAVTVARALARGALERVSRGTYRRHGVQYVFGSELAEIIARAPRGIACLFSAAAFHRLGTVEPPESWLALPHATRPPRIEWPPVRWVFWRPELAFRIGITERLICGVTVRLTDPVRTVVDMLRTSRTVGEDRALEVLRDYLAGGGSMPALQTMADQFRVGRLVRPYLKAFAYLGRPSDD